MREYIYIYIYTCIYIYIYTSVQSKETSSCLWLQSSDSSASLKRDRESPYTPQTSCMQQLSASPHAAAANLLPFKLSPRPSIEVRVLSNPKGAPYCGPHFWVPPCWGPHFWGGPYWGAPLTNLWVGRGPLPIGGPSPDRLRGPPSGCIGAPLGKAPPPPIPRFCLERGPPSEGGPQFGLQKGPPM